jgi:hypothetical protein
MMTKADIEKLIITLAKIPPLPDECEPPKEKLPPCRKNIFVFADSG